MSGTDFTVTPNYGLYKPIYNADDEAWGDHWNDNADVIDAQMAANAAALTNYLPLTGGTLSGPLQLPNGTLAVPGLAFGAADGTGLSRAANALVFGVQGNMILAMFAGSAQFYSTLGMLNNPITQMADAVNPGDALNMRSGDVRYLQLSGADARYLQLSGGALTGPLTLAADPATAMQPVTLQYLTAAVAPALHNVGRNLIHNPLFNVAQRGAGPWTTSVYTADRWAIWAAHTNGSASVTRPALADADRTAIGDEEAGAALQYTFTGGTGATDVDAVLQKIEDLSRLAGKTVTISFWAKAAAGAPRIGIGISQFFGTGGSPSAPVTVNATPVTISTTFARYSVTLAAPSAAGKTYGVNGDHRTELDLYYSSGTTNNAAAGGIGVQSGTIFLWGVQLEIGAVASPLEKPDPQQDLAKCQRFYATGHAILQAYGTAGMPVNTAGSLPVSMRTFPTITLANNYSFNIGAITWAALGVTCGASAAATVTAAGMFAISATFLASADL